MNKAWMLLGILCIALLGSNAYLLRINHELGVRNRTLEATQLPVVGAPLSPIAVHGVGGQEHPLGFRSDARAHLLLVMSPDCPYCTKNWPMWDSLVKGVSADVAVTYFDVTGKFDKRISAEHGIKDEQLLTAPLASATQARIIGTPTTLLISRNGLVKGVWQGVLDQEQVGDILAAAR